MSKKNPLTPGGIEPATFRFVAQQLNHCPTAVTPPYKTTPHYLTSSVCVIFAVSPNTCHFILYGQISQFFNLSTINFLRNMYSLYLSIWSQKKVLYPNSLFHAFQIYKNPSLYFCACAIYPFLYNELVRMR